MKPRLRLRTPESFHEHLLPTGSLGRPLSTLLATFGHPLNTRCGGRGLCHACEVELVAGAVCSLDTEALVGAPGRIAACRHRPVVGESISLTVPARALLRHEPSIASQFTLSISCALQPLGPHPADPDEPWFGAAVDLGTTTVALLLCDLRTGMVLGIDTAFNAQVRFGEDVLTRINFCSGRPEQQLQLQDAAASTIQTLLENTCARHHVDLAHVQSLVVAGNTAMLHLLAGADPAPLGVYPFKPAFLGHRCLRPEDCELAFGGTSAEVHLIPSPAAYVGADLAAGILATNLLYDEGPALLVDVGTNGEIILKHGDRLLGCATAAGPAFEGAGLASGMRAVHGVIEAIRFSRDPWEIHLGIIGDTTTPIGICGSAYVDLIAEGRRTGLLNEHGRLQAPNSSEAGRGLRILADGSRAFVLGTSHDDDPIIVTESDIARLLQAKAAIAAGITTLLTLAGLTPGDIVKVHLAGGFGLHLNLNNAIACGLLPGFRVDQIDVVGNTALGGAFALLQDRTLLSEVVQACTTLESIELNLQSGFEDYYIDQLALP